MLRLPGADSHTLPWSAVPCAVAHPSGCGPDSGGQGSHNLTMGGHMALTPWGRSARLVLGDGGREGRASSATIDPRAVMFLAIPEPEPTPEAVNVWLRCAAAGERGPSRGWSPIWPML